MDIDESNFEDGERRADYVIVTDDIKSKVLQKFLNNLNSKGLKYEVAEGKTVLKTFILLHLSENTFEYYSNVYDVGLEEKRPYINTHMRMFGKFSVCPISEIPDRKRGELFSSDRIIIIHKILQSMGLSDLMDRKIIETAYPLHDGPYIKSPTSVKMNDRQLLMKYWSRLSVFDKEAPLDLIKKYFGTEVAFYFAWLEFFNIMLLPMAIIGVLVVVVNILILKFVYIDQIEKICEAKNVSVCPVCEISELCYFRSLSSYCEGVRHSYLFDNHWTVGYAICMSLWATIFLNYWKRQQSKLSLKWDAKFEDIGDIRPEYLKRATQTKRNIFTGEPEVCVPRMEQVRRVTLSVAFCLILVLMMLFTVVVLTLMKMSIKKLLKRWTFSKHYVLPLNLTISSIITVIVIRLFGELFYGKMILKLTNLENPKTQSDYDKSVLYKKYVFAFTNNYVTMFYLAFMKGVFYKYPEEQKLNFFVRFKRDTCQPLNCVIEVGVQLAFILSLKRMVGNVLVLIRPVFVNMIKKIIRKKVVEEVLPQFEEEYFLQPVGKYVLMAEFTEMIIEYGFVTFFVASFPLAPLLALISNLAEHRLDAFKFVTRYRRPVPKRVSGIGSWYGILWGMTYLSMATNAFVIVFSSDFVNREVYRYTHNRNMTKYVNSSLSEFLTKDKAAFSLLNPPEVCVYKGWRYPYYHKKKYQRDMRYWKYFTWKLIAVFVFENFVFVLNWLLVQTISSIPYSVKEHLHRDEKLAKDAKLNISDQEKRELEKLGLRNRRSFITTGPVTGIL